MTEPFTSRPQPFFLTTRDLDASISTTKNTNFFLLLFYLAAELRRAVDGAVTILGHSLSLAPWDREARGRSESDTVMRAGVPCGGASRCSAVRGLQR